MIYMDITLSPTDYNARKEVMKILINGLPRLLLNYKTSNKRCLTLCIYFVCFLLCYQRFYSLIYYSTRDTNEIK